MIWVYTFIIVSVCFLIFVSGQWIFSINRSRRQGTYPAKENPTMFDVRRLIQEGEKEAAILVYCEIFETGRREAKKAVDELERSILEKNSELE